VRYRYIALKYTGRTRPNAAFQSIWDAFGTWPLQSTTVWHPATDIYETQDKVIVVVEVAGVSEDDLTVTLFSDLLVVEGTRKQPAFADMNACHQLGIKYGDFRSEIALHAPIDHDTVKAEYKHGFLKITLNKLD
jgi:HSP20 family protein